MLLLIFESAIYSCLNVGAATKEALPRLILLKYKGGTESDLVALVGKGITFDTGGMNLKPTKSIEDMYMDMG